ncbi:hypothetical protein HOE22_11690 [Candidatus Woesearchaeota archaeon]|jgi:hypothetical protein|nr:hypothetical protein [Candidatus Woesearchaeota archaeon]
MNKSEQLKKEQLLEALVKSLGIVSTACASVGMSRTTYYKYYNEDKGFKTLVDDISDVAIDFAESKLFDLIREGNPTAIIFYLKTKGKKRGYVEKQEIDLGDNYPTNITVEFVSPDGQALKMLD